MTCLLMALRLSINRLGHLLRPNCSVLSSKRKMADNPIKDIKFDDLKSKLEKGKISLIDVREPQELRDDGKIPNSVNIPLGEIVDAFKLPEPSFRSKYGFPKPDKSDAIAISCRSGKRASAAFNKILPLGYENSFVYLGSFQDWLKSGGPVEKGS